MIKDGLGFSLAYFEDMEYLGSNSGTKVYAGAYTYWWPEKHKLFKNGLYHFLSVVFNYDFASINIQTISRTMDYNS